MTSYKTDLIQKLLFYAQTYEFNRSCAIASSNNFRILTASSSNLINAFLSSIDSGLRTKALTALADFKSISSNFLLSDLISLIVSSGLFNSPIWQLLLNRYFFNAADVLTPAESFIFIGLLPG